MSRRAALKAALLVLLSLLVLFLRRPDQFLHPYVWVEDGTVILKAYAERGFASIVEPVQGYHILVSKMIALAAFKLSIMWTPELMLVLAVAFTIAVLLAVALSPTYLPWPFACALAVLFVPTGPEVFAVSEYSFWWAGLLLILALLWDTSRGRAWLRWLYLIFGGLSSPVIGPIALLLGLRATIERRSSEYIALAIAATAAVIQLVTAYLRADMGASAQWSTVWVAVQKFYGLYFIGGDPSDTKSFITYGLFCAAGLIVAAVAARRRLDRNFMLLVGTNVLICLISFLRVPAEAPHPFLAGPRYFFYPFITLSWIALWVAAKSSPPIRYGITAVCCSSPALSLFAMSLRHETIDWRRHITACAQSERYDVPIHYNGNASMAWDLDLLGEQCRKLISGSLF